MYKLLFILSTFIIMNVQLFAQEEGYEDALSPIENEGNQVNTKDLVGKITVKDLYAFSDFDLESTYDFDDTELEQLDFLAKALLNYDLYIFLGTWCSDSHELIPEVIAVLDAMQIQPKQYVLYALDASKKSPEGLEQQMNIQFVPTLVLIDKATKKEIGRIVENAPNGIINELMQIVE